jgi:hypothetical protein
MPTPLRLSDSELDAVFAAARPIVPSKRDAFLQSLASELARQSELGPGAIYRAIREVQKKFFDPPLSTAEIGKPSQPRMHHGKYA